jgi:glycosyltransferase involved in cell wall biosynthesis
MTILSLAMIVKNEEKTLARVLEAASQFCDEMIIVDTGSTDSTCDIIRQYQNKGARLEHFKWCDDFAAARNYSFSLCHGDWIIWLDADDALPDSTIEIGQRIKNELLPTTDKLTVMGAYVYSYGTDGKPLVIQNRERFIRNHVGLKWQGRIHEVIVGAETQFAICPEFIVEHRPTEHHMERKEGRNLGIFESYINVDTATTRELFLYAQELHTAKLYDKAIYAYKRYIDTFPADNYDYFQEPYIVRINLAMCYRETGQLGPSLKVAADAIAYDPTRAEAYCLMAMTYFEQGNIRAAFPLFLAGAACERPDNGGFIYEIFYSKHVKDMVKECKLALDKDKQDAVEARNKSAHAREKRSQDDQRGLSPAPSNVDSEASPAKS